MDKHISRFMNIINKCEFASECSLLCDDLNYKNFVKLNEIIDGFLLGLSHSEFNLYINIIDNYNEINLDLINSLKFSDSEIYNLKIYFLFNNISAASYFTEFSLWSEASRYIEIAIKIMNNSSFYNEWILNIKLAKRPHERIIMIRYSIVRFKLSKANFNDYDICHDIYINTSQYILLDHEATPEDINFLCSYALLLGISKPVDSYDVFKLANQLELQFSIEKIRCEKLALLIAEIFIGSFGKYLKVDGQKWFDEGVKLDYLKKDKEAGCRFKINWLTREDNFDETLIIECIKEFILYLSSKANNDTLILWQNKQLFSDIFLVVLIKAYEMGKYKLAIELSYIWKVYCAENQDITLDDYILLVIPNYDYNIIIYIFKYKENYYKYTFNRDMNFREFIKFKDKCYQTNTVFHEDIKENNIVVESKNTPHLPSLENYYDILCKFYCLDNIINQIDEFKLDKELRVFESTNLNTPITSILQKKLDCAVTYISSGEIKTNLIIKQVLIWCNPDGTLFSSQLELEAILAILKEQNIKYDIYNEETCKKEIFTKLYLSDKYDLIWIISHSSYNYKNPFKSSLTVESEQDISLYELVKLTSSLNKNRILFLNTCESGIGPVMEHSMLFSGFGSGLTTQKQSVVAHQWTVDSFASAIFAALLFLNYFELNPFELALKRPKMIFR